MAWTAPRTWVVGELVTAAYMNSHVRDNLKYLKGQAGAVDLEDVVNITQTGGFHQISLIKSGENVKSFLGTAASAVFWDINRNTTTGTFGDSAKSHARLKLDGSGTSSFIAFHTASVANTNAPESARIDGSGNLGIGTIAPQGKLHVVGAGGGFLHLTASAVTSIQTLAAAGTITSGAVLYAMDHNNTGGGNYFVSGGVLLAPGGGGATYVNTDTMKIDITAAGAVTVQRTSGTNGTHNINMWLLYF